MPTHVQDKINFMLMQLYSKLVNRIAPLSLSSASQALVDGRACNLSCQNCFLLCDDQICRSADGRMNISVFGKYASCTACTKSAETAVHRHQALYCHIVTQHCRVWVLLDLSSKIDCG